MNRRQFLFFTKQNQNTLELSGEQLFMRYLDSTLDGSTAELFSKLELTLSTVNMVRLTGTSWLNSEELKPVQSILAAFRDRGGRIE